MADRLRLGRSHADTVYLQTGDQPDSGDQRIAVFMGPDAERYAAGFVALDAKHFQPAGPPAERKLIGPPHAHQDAPCTDACHEPAGARDADGFLRLKGTGTGDNQLDPEPQRHPHGERVQCGSTAPHRPHYGEDRNDGRWCPGLAPDPEPQPAESGMVADDCSWCQAHGYTPGQQLTHEGVPVEPREPRVWEQLDPGTDDLKVVECLGVRYTRGADSLWYGDRTSRTWLQLRAMGEVREVLT